MASTRPTLSARRPRPMRFAVLGLSLLVAVTSWLSEVPVTRALDPSASPEPSVAAEASPAPTTQPSLSPEPTAVPTTEPTVTPTPTQEPPAVEPNASEPDAPPNAHPIVVPEPGKDPELVDRRTATSRSWAVGDGQVTTELFPSPIFYRPNGTDDYVPINLDFRAGQDGQASVVASSTQVTVGATDSRSPVLSLTSADGFTIGYSPVQPDGTDRVAGSPTLTGSVADVARVLPGVDLRVSARSDGANTWLVLAEAPTEARWTFALHVPTDTSVTPDETGGLELRDARGQVRALIAAPYAIDSTPDAFTGSGRMTTKLHYELGTAADGRPTLTTVLDDADWLAKAVYPVYVDPSTTLVGPGSNTYGDSFVNQGNPSQNYANYQRPDSPTFYELWLGESPSDSTYKNTALVKFDISTILGRAIDAAEFRLRPYHAYYDAPTERGIWARQITSTWAESTVNWTNRPNWTGSVTTTCAEASTLSCLLDVTTWTRTWVSGSAANHGFAVDTGAYNYTYWKRLISAEQVHSTSPRLYVTYRDPVVAVGPMGGATVSSRTLSWRYEAALTGVQGKHRVEVSTDPTFVAAPVVSSGDVTGAAVGWTIPSATSLLTGTTYHWRVQVQIGSSTTWSPWSNPGSFVWDPVANLGNQPQHSFESWDLGAGDGLAVNVATGNLTAIHPIVDLPIRGGSLPITLAYNAHDAADVGFGPGWRLDLQRRLTINADNSVTFTDGSGARHWFDDTSTAGGITQYAIPPTTDARLVRDTNQTGQEFTLTYKDRTSDVFKTVGSSGLLRFIRDRQGSINQVTVNYSGSTTDITTVVDPTGRTITFSWNADAIHHVTSIVDWAVVSGGIVQASGTPNRTNRFFYTAGVLQGWADPLNTASSSCPGPASHLTCLTYAGGLLATVAKTRTTTTFTTGALATATPVATTAVTYRGTEVAAIRDPIQDGTTETKVVRSAPAIVTVTRVGAPDLVTAYALEAAPDLHARISTVTRAPGSGQIVSKTTWHSTYATKVASTTEAFGDPLARTTSNTWAAGAIGPNLTVTSEPIATTPLAESRITTTTFNGNDDVTQTVVASSLGGSTTTVYSYSPATECAGVLLLCSVIENFVNGSPGGTAGHVEDVTTDYRYDLTGFGLRTRETRHNYQANDPIALDDRAIGWSYDANGNQTAEIRNYASGSVTGPTGDDITPNAGNNARTDLTTAFAYDTAGNRVSVADPRRAIETAKSTSLGPDDYITRSVYDALGQVLTSRLATTPVAYGGADCSPTPACRETTSLYDETGAVRESSDINDLVTATRFDLAGRALETYEDPYPVGGASITSISTFDAAGRLLTSKDRRQAADTALGYSQRAYNALGQTIADAWAVGTDPLLDIDTETDYVYDTLDRRTSMLTGVEEPLTSQKTIWTYDIGGRTTRTDDEFTCTSTTYDYRDLPTQVIEGQTTLACSGAGLRTITNTHDSLGRLTLSSITAGAGNGDKVAESSYDSAGNTRTSSATRSGVTTSTTYTLNPLDQATVEIRSTGTWAKTNFDAAGNATDRCLWSANPSDPCKAVGQTFANPQPTSVTTSTFDARNNRTALADASTNATTTYDPAHNYLVWGTYLPTGNGREHQTVNQYDNRHRLETVTQLLCSTNQRPICLSPDIVTTTATDTYAYDDGDNRTRVNEANGAGSLDRHYCYDAVERLISTRSATGCATGLLDTYTYDDSGNRESATGVTYAYNGSGQLTSCTSGCSTVAHDSAGRMQKLNGWFYEYDADGRMIRACQATSCTGSPTKVEFTYDGDGHRTQTKEFTSGTLTRTWDFRYQGDAIVEEKLTDSAHPSGTVVRRYVVDEAGSIVKMTIPAGETGAGTYLVTWNGHGDALALWLINATTGALTLANSFTYSTWGTPQPTTHNSIPDLGFRFLYVGEFDVQWDNAYGMGLFYMHARHYSPALGRFLQPDPDASEANLYAYTSNNPVTEIDPTGTCFILCAVLNATIDTAIYLATTENATLEGAVTAAAVGAVTGALGVGLLSKMTKIGSFAAKALTKVPKASRSFQRAFSRATSRGSQACARVGHSFDGETLVTLADGTQVPIAALVIGDLVLAWDEPTGETGAYPVTAVWVHDDPVTGIVVIEDEAIATTPSHPFYVVGRGWVAASDLAIGDQVQSATSEFGTVSAVSWDRGADTMYDLTVAVAHTYMVGDGAWRVHNCDDVQELIDKANKAFPRKAGRPDEWHHIHPIYLRGSRRGPQVRIPSAYHQRITNAFRERAPYGRPKPNPAAVRRIMREVYDEYPIDGFGRR